MRPLTDSTPKPLLPVRGKPLIEWHLLALAAAGVREVVINTAWLEDQFPVALGDGSRWGLRITYSHEGIRYGGALETGGGVATALQHLAVDKDEPFWLVSGDIYMPGFDFSAAHVQAFAQREDWGLLWMVPNPAFNAKGDFHLDAANRLHRLHRTPDAADGAPAATQAVEPANPMTYASFALLRAAMVEGLSPGTRASLAPCLFRAADAGRLAGLRWDGAWENVGTPEQWRALQS